MGHLVRYSSPDGEERYEDVMDLDAAVERVEHLRNSQGVSDVRVYREVPLEFRTYVRVAVADEEGGSSSPDPAPGSPSSGDASDPASDPSSAATPSGAAVISPPPASARSSSEAEGQAREAEASAVQGDAEARSAAKNRRSSLFNRGQAS